MKKIAILALVAFFAVVGIAAADTIEGKVKSVDKDKKEFVMEDGTTLTWAEDVFVVGSLEELKEGKQVKASYEEKDGQKVVNNIEMSYQ